MAGIAMARAHGLADSGWKSVIFFAALLSAALCAAGLYLAREGNAKQERNAVLSPASITVRTPPVGVLFARGAGGKPPPAPTERARDDVIDLVYLAQPDTVMPLRLDAIVALGDTDDPLAVLALRTMLDDENVAVRREAVETLGVFGGVDAIEGLAYALSDADAIVRQVAIESLAQMSDKTAFGALALTLGEPDTELRKFALEALAENGSDEAIALLQRFAADDNPTVRRLATEHLAERMMRALE